MAGFTGYIAHDSEIHDQNGKQNAQNANRHEQFYKTEPFAV